MPIISLKQQTKRLQVANFELENPIVFSYFDRLPASERDDMLLRAINIGVLALMEDRLSAFLAKTTNELGTELESLKMLFDMKQEIFFKSSVKGAIAEEDISNYLSELVTERNFKDEVIMTGSSTGAIKHNKTGDIVCRVDQRDDIKIVVESKFDKGISLGDIASKEIFNKSTDTAWSQLLESKVNREARAAIIVFDYSTVNAAILKSVVNLKYISSIGFIVLVDSQKGDYSNLGIAYFLSRDIALNKVSSDLDASVLSIIINRIIKDLYDIRSIKKLVNDNITNNQKILSRIEQSILSVEFSHKYLSKFLLDGNLSSEDLLEFYAGESIRDKYKMIEKSINDDHIPTS